MYIARILYPVKVLGPGNRIGIWVCGCPHRCPGCSNPELWEFQERYHTTLDTVMELIRSISRQAPVDGFTITGGEPFYQYDELNQLVSQLQEISPDILVYSGYTKEQLADKDLTHIAVLVDGPYIENRNTNVPLRGSDNQTIHILKDEFRKKYEDYLSSTHNQIQNFTTKDGIISVGIHKPDFAKVFSQTIVDKKSGLIECK